MSFSQPTSSFKVGLTAEEKKLYSQFFKSLDTENTGIVSGEKARSFEKFGLPPAILGEIWQIADSNNLGFLTQFGFCLAMRLIGQAQTGKYPTLALAEKPGPLPKFNNFSFASPTATPTQLNPQPSNNSSFMQTQPSAIIPQNTATFNSSPQDSITNVTLADYQKFGQLFVKTVGSTQGELGGAKAKDIFLKARLPTNTLGQIWNLVDKDNLGKLNIYAFVIAMHLIHGVLSGVIKQLPPFLPESVWASVESFSSGSAPQQQHQQQQKPVANTLEPPQPSSRQPSYSSVSSQQTTVRHPQQSPSREPSVSNAWVISPTLKQQYEAIFDNLDKSKSGQLNSDQVASVLMSSKLNQEDLATVWDLSDIQNTGIFTKLEFIIALYLVNRKLSGGALPNIVPDSLIDSINGIQPSSPQQIQQVQQPQQQQQQQPVQQKAIQPAKTAMDDLVDIFGSGNASPNVKTPTTSNFNLNSSSPSYSGVVQRTTSSSDLTPPPSAGDFPKVRQNLTGSFKPTSTFGQSLLHKQPLESPREEKEEESLLGEDHAPAAATAPVVEATPAPKQHTVNYDALRSVPPPPSQKSVSQQSRQSAVSPVPSQQTYSSAPQQHQQQQQYQQKGFAPISAGNTDLLADNDSEVSGQLSQATSDIANVSNQIKSLAGQTSGLQEKKIRAEQELAKILSTKKEIEAKLKQLRSSYDNEVKQVDQVEANLVTAREETEALRSESSISEAKFNHLSTELNDKQIAMEELQKQNSATKEKLGYLNAEIVELEKQITQSTAENQRLTNQVNVQKSQVQVSIVKNEELKAKILEIEEGNRKLAEEYRVAEEEQRRAEEEAKLLHQRQLEAERNKPVAPPISKKVEPTPVQSVSKEVESASTQQVSKEAESIPVQQISKEVAAAPEHASSQEFSVPGAFVEDSDEKSISHAPHTDSTVAGSAVTGSAVTGAAALVGGAVAGTVAVLGFGGENKSESEPVPEPEPVVEKREEADEQTSVAPEIETKSKSIETESKEPTSTYEEPQDYEKEINAVTTNYHPESTTATSTSSTNGYQDNETPVTSPNNSEFQFPQGTNAGIVGGMVGMPGVLFGVQRTDSLTSSVQNNAALSVRDDNIEGISDRETLEEGEQGELQAPSSNSTSRAINKEVAEEVDINPPAQRNNEDTSDGDKISSGVESFEMVNADELNGSHELPSYAQTVSSVPPPLPPHGSKLSNSPIVNDSPTEIDQEFPPIKELDYDESSSSDESRDNFDDAVDQLPSTRDVSKEVKTAEQHPDPTINFDSAFEDLEPASPERLDINPQSDIPTNADDFFGNEFDGLQEAAPEDYDEFAMDNTFDFNEKFVSNDQDESDFPDFGVPETTSAPVTSGNATGAGTDEWEQLFAGFGNAGLQNAVPETNPVAVHHTSSTITPNFGNPGSGSAANVVDQGLVEELKGMGFDEKTALEALEKEGWDLQAATNFLLDHA
ncbi:EH domain-containing and endocytosis protein 1 [[Candida] railenensis]|uniref:EH domain-containing and endocytosis protein 1 n=1 Tax=[Candida] railenensis TaxID=45579 RepID=A0A9P0W0Y1_9ASCO|nr:EH domain-containing and endocytosis protein 1 [[Candida] railenensis]